MRLVDRGWTPDQFETALAGPLAAVLSHLPDPAQATIVAADRGGAVHHAGGPGASRLALVASGDVAETAPHVPKI